MIKSKNNKKLKKPKSKKLALALHSHRLVRYCLATSLLIVLVVHAQPSPVLTSRPDSKESYPVKPAVPKKTEVIASPPKAAAAPASTPTPAAPALAKPVVHTTPAPADVRTSSDPQPVVTPSPSSSVNSLKPASTSTPAPATAQPGSASSAPAPTTTTTTSYTSTNWSGYLATNSTYSAISGAWTATNPTGNGSSTSADASWIGIGGVSSSDLIQIGTDNTVSASGQVTSGAFYEMLPASSITIPNFSVNPGDQMNASISEISSSQWQLTINDTTNGQSFTKDVSYASQNSSAEWIEEDPSYSQHHQIPFDNFGSVNFSAASTTADGNTLNLNGAAAQPITMVNQSDQPIATPSAIANDGASFSVSQDQTNGKLLRR